MDSDDDYQKLLTLIDTLFENYDVNITLIDLLCPILEKYEQSAECFKSFNEKHEASDHQASMLSVIMDQHNLTSEDCYAEHLIESQSNTLPLDANGVASKFYRHITNEWQISAEESRKLFSFLDDKQFESWLSGGLHLEQPDILVLVSHLMAIYKLLHQLYLDPAQANAWMTKPNEYFQHRSCLDIIAADGLDGALVVKRYLESQLT
jgi:antitoxin component HigA of HigAB toxin-antitoxin module